MECASLVSAALELACAEPTEVFGCRGDYVQEQLHLNTPNILA